MGISATESMPETDAKEAGLRYITDDIIGITRKRASVGFIYLDPEGRIIRNKLTLERIRKLVIPPAWEKVWISPYRNSHIQATGIDKKGRKQYRYHEKWAFIRSEKKFLRMKAFGEVLPKIREEIARHLRLKKLSRQKVLATAVSLLDKTLIRVGNEEYTKENESFGLTTLQDGHVKNLGSEIRLEFKGKRKIEREIIINDKKLANLIKKCRDIPGYELFQYYDTNGERHKISSEDVNDYIREISGLDITAKYFRTWGGSCIAIKALMEFENSENEKVIKKNLVQAIRRVSGCLGNTPSVCKKFYIHPIILDKYSENELVRKIHAINKKGIKGSDWLSWEEKVFLHILEEYSQA